MRLSLEEKRVIDKYLYKYKGWERLRKTCIEEAEWISARYGERSASDFSDIAELGTSIQTSNPPSSPQERVYSHKIRIMREQQDYAAILTMRMRRVERAMEDMDDLTRQLLEERYFNRKSMDECINSIDGMTENKYRSCIAKIRYSLSGYVLGVFVES